MTQRVVKLVGSPRFPSVARRHNPTLHGDWLMRDDAYSCERRCVLRARNQSTPFRALMVDILWFLFSVLLFNMSGTQIPRSERLQRKVWETQDPGKLK